MENEMKIYNFMKWIGVPSHFKGYHYIKAALPIVTDAYAKGETVRMMKELYPSVAEQFDSTPQRVERAIRHAIQRTFDEITTEVYGEVFRELSYNIDYPTNSQFFSICAGYLVHNQVE